MSVQLLPPPNRSSPPTSRPAAANETARNRGRTSDFNAHLDRRPRQTSQQTAPTPAAEPAAAGRLHADVADAQAAEPPAKPEQEVAAAPADPQVSALAATTSMRHVFDVEAQPAAEDGTEPDPVYWQDVGAMRPAAVGADAAAAPLMPVKRQADDALPAGTTPASTTGSVAGHAPSAAAPKRVAQPAESGVVRANEGISATSAEAKPVATQLLGLEADGDAPPAVSASPATAAHPAQRVSASATSDAAAPSAAVDTENEIVRAASAASRHGQTVTVRLDPPSLGSVRVQVRLTGGEMTASIGTSSDVAHGLVRGNVEQLKVALEKAGVFVDRISVTRMAPLAAPEASGQARNDPQHDASGRQPDGNKPGGGTTSDAGGDRSSGRDASDDRLREHNLRLATLRRWRAGA